VKRRLAVTIRDIFSAMLRHWYIPLGLIACAALITVLLARDGGIYTTKTLVSFLRPDSTSLSPSNGMNDSSVIAFAGSVVLETNNGHPPAGYSMEDAPYYGAGIRQGVLVELANSGNQWASTFNKAEVQIQIVGRSRAWVESRQKEAVGKVLSIAESRQRDMAIAPQNRIFASAVPVTTQIEYVGASRSSQLAAWAAMLVAAITIGAWGSVIVDRMPSRRRSTTTTKVARPSGRTLEGVQL
jgi:hypothetical protein